MKLSLVVPTLNEAGSIPALFGRLDSARQALPGGTELEVVLVDDGSTDGTVETARRTRTGFVLKTVERRERGLATAVLAGFSAASGDWLGVIDADLSHPPELLPALVAALEENDVVVASRHALGGQVEEWPWYRLYASLFMSKLARPLHLPIKDALSGYFLLRRSVIDGVALNPLGYKILLEILVKGRYVKAVEIPYVFRNRGVGKSKMDLKITAQYLVHLARLYAWKRNSGANVRTGSR